MVKLFTVLLTSLFFVNTSFGQLIGFPANIKVDHDKLPIIDLKSSKRSAQAPTKCGRDTVEYPRLKTTQNYNFITVNKGRGLGQLFSTPKTITLYGFSFYAILATNPPTAKTLRLICNVYKAGADSLPKGFPLRSDTVTIDTNFYKGELIKMVRHATFKTPISLDSAYILTVESDSVNLNTYALVNGYAQGDGRKENLNCGSISGTWYNGKNLNVGSIPFNCDILLHPHVQYSVGADYTIKGQCYNINDTIKFVNSAPKTIVGSKMYNKYVFYNIANYCNWWNTGDGWGTTYSVDHKVKYSQRQNYKVQLISIVYGYKGPMQYGCSDTVEKWVYYKPDYPQVSGPANACVGDTAKFTITNADTGAIYQWYKKVTDASPFFTGTVYTKPSLVKTDTFYLRGNNHNCVTSYRTIILNVNSYPSSLTIKNDSICSGAKANLKGFTNIGNIEWFETAISPIPVYTGNVLQTPVLTRDTFFYVRANNKGCLKSPRVKVNAYVGASFAPAPPGITNDTAICLAKTSNLLLSASTGGGLTIRWYDAGSGSSSIATGNTYNFIPTIREVKTFYADAYNGVCGSTRIPVEITVEDFPKVSKVINDTICNGDSLIMSVDIPFGQADWYDAATSGNLLYTGGRYASTPTLAANYFVETVSGICKSTNRTVVRGQVNTFPVVNKVWGDTICAKHKATLKSKLTGAGTMHWFEYDTSSVELGKGKTLQTFVLNGSKTFYAQPEYAGCFGPKQIVAPLVKPIPFPGFSFEVFSNNQSVKVSALNPGSANIRWDFGDGQISGLATVTHYYGNPGNYIIKLTLTGTNGCKDTQINMAPIVTGGLHTVSNLPTLTIYPNPAQKELNVELKQAEGKAEYEIYSITGSLIRKEKTGIEDHHLKIDLNAISAGLYMLKINGYQAIMFIVE